MAQQRGVVIEIRTELMAETPIVGVESEIREALINLIFNAVDAMPSGGRMTISTELAVDTLGRQVLLKVEDTGVGMNEETRQRCMEPFFTTKGDRGSGLGLAMVYGVAHRHSAGVDIASVLGEGTIMKLSFPVSQSAPAIYGPLDGSPPLTALHLLLVDDDPQLRKSLCDILEADGHTVVVSEDGAQGVAAFEAALWEGKAFQAVITDLGMPHMSGLAVAGALKRAAPSTPVILLTGWGQNYPGAPPADVDCVLSKPPTLSALRTALARCHVLTKRSRSEAA
jgi:CheY-like chemotaxis protein